jgi:hypothetical protein
MRWRTREGKSVLRRCGWVEAGGGRPTGGKMTGKDVVRAIKQYKIDVEKVSPFGV